MPEILWAEPCTRGQRCEHTEQDLSRCPNPGTAFGSWEEEAAGRGTQTMGIVVCARHLRSYGWTGPMPVAVEEAPKSRRDPYPEERRVRPFAPRGLAKVGRAADNVVDRLQKRLDKLATAKEDAYRVAQTAHDAWRSASKERPKPRLVVADDGDLRCG